MNNRATWFLLGAATASAFWILVMGGIGREWLKILMSV